MRDTCSWYKRSEFGIRAAVFFSAATVSGAFGGLLAVRICISSIPYVYPAPKLTEFPWIWFSSAHVLMLMNVRTSFLAHA